MMCILHLVLYCVVEHYEICEIWKSLKEPKVFIRFLEGALIVPKTEMMTLIY